MSNQVYFIRCGDDGPVKIGWSSNLKSRFRYIAQGLPDRARIEATLPGGRELERRLHRALHASRRRLEWFDPTPDVRITIAIARLRGLPAILRWLDAKEAAHEIRQSPAATDDFDTDLRALCAHSFKVAVARHGKAVVASAVGRSIDSIEKYSSGKSVPGAATLGALSVLDAGAVEPFMARCANRQTIEEARDALDALLGRVRVAA